MTTSTTSKIPAAIIRGGTSKGLFFDKDLLPPEGDSRDSLLLSIMGSPDSSGMQLNGLGGGISSTSKIALVSKSTRPGIDIDYKFGQVSLRNPEIDWLGSCGNLAAAAGLYAIHRGFVKTENDGSAHIKIWQENIGYKIDLAITSAEEKNLISIPGVPGRSAAIYVNFYNLSSSLLPNGQPIHTLNLSNGKRISATLICGANPTIFLNAADIGFSGKELPHEIPYNDFKTLWEVIGRQGAHIMKVPYTPAVRVAWLATPSDYVTSEGLMIHKDTVDILSRITTEGRVHHAYTGSGAVNLASAAKIPGTIPFNILSHCLSKQPERTVLNIGHPMGRMQVSAHVAFDETTKNWLAVRSGFTRTAKILMVGDVNI